MQTLLDLWGLEMKAAWSRSTTYHLEVKTTTGDYNEPFFVTQNQVDMVGLKSCISCP